MNSRKLQNVSPKSGHLREVVTYWSWLSSRGSCKCIEFTANIMYFGKVMKLMGGGRLRELVAQVGSTVCILLTDPHTKLVNTN